MTVTNGDTVAAASICAAMADQHQIAGLVVGITTALNEPAVAGEVLRMIEALMDERGTLANYRQMRDQSAVSLAELRRYLND